MSLYALSKSLYKTMADYYGRTWRNNVSRRHKLIYFAQCVSDIQVSVAHFFDFNYGNFLFILNLVLLIGKISRTEVQNLS